MQKKSNVEFVRAAHIVLGENGNAKFSRRAIRWQEQPPRRPQISFSRFKVFFVLVPAQPRSGHQGTARPALYLPGVDFFPTFRSINNL